jgi:hypothetical protein
MDETRACMLHMHQALVDRNAKGWKFELEGPDSFVMGNEVHSAPMRVLATQTRVQIWVDPRVVRGMVRSSVRFSNGDVEYMSYVNDECFMRFLKIDDYWVHEAYARNIEDEFNDYLAGMVMLQILCA